MNTGRLWRGFSFNCHVCICSSLVGADRAPLPGAPQGTSLGSAGGRGSDPQRKQKVHLVLRLPVASCPFISQTCVGCVCLSVFYW